MQTSTEITSLNLETGVDDVQSGNEASFRQTMANLLATSKFSLFFQEYQHVYAIDLNQPLYDDAEYMQFVEVYFLVRNMRELCMMQLYQSYSRLDSWASKASDETYFKIMSADRKQLHIDIQLLDQVTEKLRSYRASRLQACVEKGSSFPLIVQLCSIYKFTQKETELFHLMAVVQGSNHPQVLNSLTEEDVLRKMSAFQRLSGMSEVDVDIFCDAERAHMRENIVTVDEENNYQFNLRIQKTAVQLLYGRKVRSDDLLKISQTSLETILLNEHNVASSASLQQSASLSSKPSSSRKRLRNDHDRDHMEETEIMEADGNHSVEDGLPSLLRPTNNELSEAQISLSPATKQRLLVLEQINGGRRPGASSRLLPSASTADRALTSGIKSMRSNSWGHSPRTLHLPPSAALLSHQNSRHGLVMATPPITRKSNGAVNSRHVLERANSLEDEEGMVVGPSSEGVILSTQSAEALVAEGPAGNMLDDSMAGSEVPVGDTVDQIPSSAISVAQTADMMILERSKGLLASRENSIDANQSGLIISGAQEIDSLASLSNLIVDNDVGIFLKPYATENQLEYLEDGFQLVALMIKGNAAKMKDDLKKEGTSRYTNNWGDGSNDLKHSKRELLAKLKLQENRMLARLQKTQAMGLPLPRLEGLVQRLHLDSFEKRLILLLIGKTVSPIVRTLIEAVDVSASRSAEDVITVGQALSILCQDFELQIANRRYFYQSGKLMKNAIISLHKARWHAGTGDLTENRVMLDRRMLDWIVGLDSEINELVEGSDLYEPKVHLSQVVLPPGYTQMILSQCLAYDYFINEYREASGLNERLPYGNSLVILLCGKSGTGKTMTVNAIAHELKKKVLLVDFNGILNKKESGHSAGGDLEVDLKGLFRESKMNNAILFFDECEVIFKSRNHGSDRIINSLLTEIERHEGMVFLATNRPHEIDEAMHRRITMVLEYRSPDRVMRKRIWDHLLHDVITQPLSTTVNPALALAGSELGDSNHLTPPFYSSSVPQFSSLQLGKDVDTSMLAAKYQLTGGFIKNAVLSALLTALSRDRQAPCISQADLISGCQMQMRGNLSHRGFEDRQQPHHSLELSQLLLPESVKQSLKKIIQYEMTRSKVYGSWSIRKEEAEEVADKKDQSDPQTTSVNGQSTALSSSTSSTSTYISSYEKACMNLLIGVRGSGKQTIVDGVAKTLGNKRMKCLHVAEFINQNLYEMAEVFRVLVKDASLVDAMIVIDGFEHLLEDPSGGSSLDGGYKLHITLSRMMDILEEFHGCVFLLAHLENAQHLHLQRDFASRLYSCIRSTMPSAELRAGLWKRLLPAAAPVAKDIDFLSLGRRFELYPGSISSAIAYAAAEVASRGTASAGKNNEIGYKDLLAGGEYESAKFKGNSADMLAKLFV